MEVKGLLEDTGEGVMELQEKEGDKKDRKQGNDSVWKRWMGDIRHGTGMGVSSNGRSRKPPVCP